MTGTRPRGLPAAVALLGVTCLLASGCSPGSTTSSATPGARVTGDASSTEGPTPASDEPTEEDFNAVTRLLAARARAATDGDVKAFLATVDPQQPKLIKQQRTLASNLARLDIAGMSYVVDRETLVVAAPVPGDAPTFRPLINEHVELTGTLHEPLVNAVQMTFVRRGTRWFLGAENQRKVRDSYESPQERPWFGEPIAMERSGGMTVLVDRSRAATTDDLIESVRSDIAYAAGILDEKPAYDVLVDATSNGHSVGFSHLSDDVAAAVSFGLYGRAGRQIGSAIKINPDDVEGALEQEGLMRHELTHFLLDDFSGSSPTWLVEGIASYVQYYPSEFSRLQVDDEFYDRLMAADRRLPIVGLFASDPAVNYPVSQAAVKWLVSRSGMSDLKRLMRAYKDGYKTVDVDALTPKLLRRVYDLREKDVVDGAFGELAKLHH